MRPRLALVFLFMCIPLKEGFLSSLALQNKTIKQPEKTNPKTQTNNPNNPTTSDLRCRLLICLGVDILDGSFPFLSKWTGVFVHLFYVQLPKLTSVILNSDYQLDKILMCPGQQGATSLSVPMKAFQGMINWGGWGREHSGCGYPIGLGNRPSKRGQRGKLAECWISRLCFSIHQPTPPALPAKPQYIYFHYGLITSWENCQSDNHLLLEKCERVIGITYL